MSEKGKIQKEHAMELIADLLEVLTEAELKTLRAKINGKLGKRSISPEAQAKMQAGRRTANAAH